MYAASALKSMLGDTVIGGLDPELMPTDRILQRWAVSIGLGLPTAAWDDRRISKPPPLDDATAIVVDQAVLKAPPMTKRLLLRWYKTPLPAAALADEFGMSRRGLYTAWGLSLNFMRLRFEMTGHDDLLKLLHVRV